MYVCMYQAHWNTCIYLFILIYAWIFVYICVYIYLRISHFTYRYVYVRIYIYTHACMYKQVHVHAYFIVMNICSYVHYLEEYLHKCIYVRV